MNLREGAILQGGKYRIERELGHGGFGVTYLATQVGLNRKVAIKEFFMSEYCNRDAETSQVTVGSEGSKELVAKFRTKFIKEAQNIACLKHPHIISIYDVFEDNGTAYYVMEYLGYGSLADLVKRQGRLSEADALRYTRQIADALRYIHARKMNHLDVKPGNILIDETDHAVLIDFGLSKRYDDEGNQTSTTPVGISHGYAPLEQYKKSGVGTFSPATDIYSLGATLYKLVTGTTPPDANDIFTDGLPSHPDVISPAVFAAIEQAMQPNKNNRPQSVEEFMALLEAEVKVEEERTVLDEDLRASLVTPSASQRSARPSINRGTVGSASSHPEGKHQQAPPLFIEGVSVGRGSSKRSAEPTPIWKKLLLPAVVCLVTAFAIIFWPEPKTGGGDTPVGPDSTTQQTEILLPAGRQNDTNQQQTTQQSQQQSAPVKKEPAAPTTTPLYVTTTPSGVTVYVDGKKVGTTPIEGKEIARGSHKVKLGKEGYEDKTLTRTFGDKPVMLNEKLATESVAEGTQGIEEGANEAERAIGLDVQGRFDLNGRSISASGLPVPINTVKDEGRVVVNITVNPAGKVIATSINRRTNTVNPELRKAAEDAAKRACFNQIDGIDNETGTITYYFKLTENPKLQQQSQSTVSSVTTSVPTEGKINGHEYVDLGLSVKWATCNVGASSPSAYGNYYAWGETGTKSEYYTTNSKTNEKSMGSIAGNASYDAARANWGGTWRLPTKAEFQELVDKCSWTWTTQGGHNGYKVTGKNGNSIFLPAAGFRYFTSLYDEGSNGDYWSSTLNSSSSGYAYCLDFNSGHYYCCSTYDRGYGYMVRPVSE